jgi:hypothetical protein
MQETTERDQEEEEAPTQNPETRVPLAPSSLLPKSKHKADKRTNSSLLAILQHL